MAFSLNVLYNKKAMALLPWLLFCEVCKFPGKRAPYSLLPKTHLKFPKGDNILFAALGVTSSVFYKRSAIKKCIEKSFQWNSCQVKRSGDVFKYVII
ncbi:hypothetical protein [Spongiimicrobium salis]|uniref:hypothetical protein n=1 Tax=Spongiimicrobium salis TaxID=1667022 RepID=UPI00374CE366